MRTASAQGVDVAEDRIVIFADVIERLLGASCCALSGANIADEGAPSASYRFAAASLSRTVALGSFSETTVGYPAGRKDEGELSVSPLLLRTRSSSRSVGNASLTRRRSAFPSLTMCVLAFCSVTIDSFSSRTGTRRLALWGAQECHRRGRWLFRWSRLGKQRERCCPPLALGRSLAQRLHSCAHADRSDGDEALLVGILRWDQTRDLCRALGWRRGPDHLLCVTLPR